MCSLSPHTENVLECIFRNNEVIVSTVEIMFAVSMKSKSIKFNIQLLTYDNIPHTARFTTFNLIVFLLYSSPIAC